MLEHSRSLELSPPILLRINLIKLKLASNRAILQSPILGFCLDFEQFSSLANPTNSILNHNISENKIMNKTTTRGYYPTPAGVLFDTSDALADELKLKQVDFCPSKLTKLLGDAFHAAFNYTYGHELSEQVLEELTDNPPTYSSIRAIQSLLGHEHKNTPEEFLKCDVVIWDLGAYDKYGELEQISTFWAKSHPEDFTALKFQSFATKWIELGGLESTKA